MPTCRDTAILDVRGVDDPAGQIASVLAAGLLPLTIIAAETPAALLAALGVCWEETACGAFWRVDVSG